MGLKIKISCIAHCKNCTWCIWIINKQSFFLYLIIGPRLWGIINRVSSKECPLPGQIFIKLLYTIKTAFTFLSQIIPAVSLTSIHEKVMVKKKSHFNIHFILYFFSTEYIVNDDCLRYEYIQCYLKLILCFSSKNPYWICSANFLASENNVDLMKNFMNYYQTKYVRYATR